VVDVRGASEFGNGHILNAVHVPHNQLDQHLSKLEKFKDRPIITTCRSGSLSAGVGNTLRKHGFAQVYHLTGGLAAWESANLPLSRG
jgi:rhodanese-related sulfurtransferase